MSAEVLKKIRKARKIEELELFLESGDLACLIEALRHGELGPKLHSRFHKDHRNSVRFEIAFHKGTSADLLEELSKDRNQLVRTTAKERLIEMKKEGVES